MFLFHGPMAAFRIHSFFFSHCMRHHKKTHMSTRRRSPFFSATAVFRLHRQHPLLAESVLQFSRSLLLQTELKSMSRAHTLTHRYVHMLWAHSGGWRHRATCAGLPCGFPTGAAQGTCPKRLGAAWAPRSPPAQGVISPPTALYSLRT